MLSHFRYVWLFVTLWTVTCHSFLSMGFSRQEYWSGLTFYPPGNLPYPGIEPAFLMSPELASRFFTTSKFYIWRKKWQTMGNPMDRGSWQAIVHIVEKSHTGLSHFLLFNRSVGYNSLQPHRLQHARLPCPSPTPQVCSNSCSSILGYHPTISPSVIPFSSYLLFFPPSESFPMS